MTRSKGGSGPSPRQLKVGEEVRHAMTRILTRDGLRDPVLTGVTIMVTEVRMSPDMRHATCFVAPLGSMPDGGTTADLVKACKRASAYMRGQLAREVNLRFVPELAFQADTSFDQAARIGALLSEPKVRADLPEDDTAEDGEDDGKAS
ncbi:30S ribosome-binding factor RbfA [Lacibacterium aquatile]|uniref:Ribosome-binding factor A n=1 Tax=Lacibacterium aquatile TaxID=1168082 RepID=A0ABW5DYB0_9PROT